MLSYQDYEKAVYDALMLKRSAQKGYNFSVRRNASKGSERDYFIGTQKGKYFGTTFWNVPINFPGSSGDLMNLFFRYTKKDELVYDFEFTQTNNPSNDQNKWALELIKNLEPLVERAVGLSKKSTPVQKSHSFRTKSKKQSYVTVAAMMTDVFNDANILIPLINTEINKLKVKHPQFIAHQITDEGFAEMQEKMMKRRGELPLTGGTSRPTISSNHSLKDLSSQPLNQILFGPPGTGKTYHTINKALEIIDDEEVRSLNWADRAQVKVLFDKKMDEGQVVFTTFHQSMTYEDFVEGIKPIQNEDDASTLGYEVQPGIFKRICDRAKAREVSNASTAWDKANYFKMSLGGKNRTDLHEWCLENNLLGLGWGGENDLTQYAMLNNWENFRDKFSRDQPAVVAHSRFNIQAAYSFLQMRKGDVVIISKGNHLIDSIGIVDGDYFFDENKPIEFVHFRPVKWVVKRINEVPGRFVTKGISQQSIYQFAKDDVILDSFKAYSPENSDRRIKPYVLIIDEINRGNVSQIFGELITLLEANKRLGRDEALEVTLPYSKEKEKFGVPANLYIIGTMNTADRSVEALDTALRRRFSFTEMPPNYELKELEYSFAGTTGKEILKTINQRIEKLLDRDHLIGHSYLMIKEGENFESKLMDAFYRNIIPLLQEYFYGDYAKIGAVLGKGFIDKKADADKIEFADFDYFEAADFADKVIYEIIDHRKAATPAESFEKAIRTLMNPKK